MGAVFEEAQLFEALDSSFAAEPEVWRPIFASLKSGSGGHGMGEVGDRVVAYIETDFAKAAADDLFEVDVDVAALARHVFNTRMNRLEKWANDAIDWTAYRSSSTLGLELILAAVLGEPHRRDALRRSGVAG